MHIPWHFDEDNFSLLKVDVFGKVGESDSMKFVSIVHSVTDIALLCRID